MAMAAEPREPEKIEEFEDILIRYDGMDADRHELDMSQLADSLKGLSRIIGVTANFAVTHKLIQHRDALQVRVVARTPDAKCFELWAAIEWISENNLAATVVGGLILSTIAYIFKKAANEREEMKQIRGALDTAIKELGTRDQVAVNRLLDTIDKMADALRPAVKQAVTPIGRTAGTLSIGGAKSGTAITLTQADKDAILSDGEVQVEEERVYRLTLTELDMDTGACKFHLANDEEEHRYNGRITDPGFSLANNRYVLSMAAQEEIAVKGKAMTKDGNIDRIFISDFVKEAGQAEPGPV